MILFLLLSLLYAETEVKLVNPDTFCRIDQFATQKGKAPCDSLKDNSDVRVKNIAECKERALKKGEACLKLAGASELSVGGRFVEKFSVSQSSTNFTCAINRAAGNLCP